MALCKKEQSRGVPLKMGFSSPDVVGVSTKAHFPENCGIVGDALWPYAKRNKVVASP